VVCRGSFDAVHGRWSCKTVPDVPVDCDIENDGDHERVIGHDGGRDAQILKI